ncbi:hypothetical protein KJ766_03035 [Patescibacteria group bacterium]|nr:hypothetical protein [Patescibacteria group bacterium]
MISSIILIAAVWFPVFWIIGGTLFAITAAMQSVKVKKAMFSLLFTFASIVFAVGAAGSGYVFGREKIDVCLTSANDFFASLAAVVGCGVLEFFLAALFWLAGLLIVGFILLYLCRAENQSWMDSDKHSKSETVLTFDN